VTRSSSFSVRTWVVAPAAFSFAIVAAALQLKVTEASWMCVLGPEYQENNHYIYE
jgi:hypothetical protein